MAKGDMGRTSVSSILGSLARTRLADAKLPWFCILERIISFPEK